MDIKALFKKDYIVGLDIGASALKLVQFVSKEDGLHLTGTETKELANAPDPEGEEKEMVAALRHIMRGIDPKKAKITVNINCPNTAIKKIMAPYMPKGELVEGIKLEAKSYFPFPIEQSLLEFEVIGDIMDKGVRKYEVVVAACPINTADKYLKLLAAAGIKPSAMVSSSYSLHKAGDNSYAAEGKTNCYLDIGRIHSELVISKEKHIMFTRKIPIAGNDFTGALTGTLVSDRGKTQLTFDEAERIKKEVGLPKEGESGMIGDKISTTEILSMLRSPLEQLTSEVDRCLDYYREETGNGRIDSLVLFGGGSALKGLDKAMSEALGIEVKIGDPFMGLKIDKGASAEQGNSPYRMALAIGAALDGGSGSINLLPKEIKDAKKILWTRGTFEAVGTAVIIAFVLLYIGMRIQLGNTDKKISAARMQLSSLKSSIAKAEAVLLARQILSDEPQWEDLFTEISNLIPDNVHIENFSMRNNVISIKGIAATKDGERLLADFMLSLESGVFDKVRMVNTKKIGETGGTEFEIQCWVDYETI